MIRHTPPPAAAAALLFSALLAACGGGGSSAPPPVTPTTVKVTGVAADGALQGATACYDLNDNGACDSAEPSSGPTDANGNFSFDIDASVAGQHRVVVAVPATAIDKDTGTAVGTAYTLQSPATGASGAQSVFVSPLTTLVQAQIDATGATLAAASDFVKTQASLAISPLADFTQSPSADAQRAALVSRLVVVTTQRQGAAVATVVGQADISGATITQADVDKAVLKAVIGVLPAVAASVNDPAIVAAATPAELKLAIDAAAATLVATQTALDATTLKTDIGVSKLPADTTPTAAAAGATLRAFTYTDANNWFYRAMEASAADNTPDANGKLHFYDVHSESAVGIAGPVVRSWGTYDKERDDLHWNGSAWMNCPLGFRSSSDPRDAQGRSSYDYCDKVEEGVSVRTALDISGQTLRSVITDTIRTFPGSDSGKAYASFGPSNLDLLGTATFPTGSTLYYYTNQALASAPAYDGRAINRVTAFSEAVAAGGDARTGSPACANAGTAQQISTLEALVARNLGQPCIFNQNTNADGTSLVPNEAWGLSTVGMGAVDNAQTLPAGTGNYYSTTARLRVAFTGAGNATTYYSCLMRRADGSTRNCTVIGAGTYTIEAMGDARIMTFSGLPAMTQRTGFNRVFVESGGKVYFGYRNVVGIERKSLRLGLTAANALFTQLGLPAIVPIPPASAADSAKAALFATAKGAWGGSDADGAVVIRFGDGGQFMMGQATPADAVGSPGGELGTIDIDPVTGIHASLLAVDSNGQWGTSHPNATDRITSITATDLVFTDGSLTRLPSDASGIVGLWALGSATDLKVNHIAFFSNGRVMMIDNQGETDPTNACYISNQGPPGVELASYTFDAATGALHVFGKIFDTNGCAGFFDSSQGAINPNTEANFVLTISADGKTATTTDGITAYRIPSQ